LVVTVVALGYATAAADERLLRLTRYCGQALRACGDTTAAAKFDADVGPASCSSVLAGVDRCRHVLTGAGGVLWLVSD
jgi:hypothetical protein